MLRGIPTRTETRSTDPNPNPYASPSPYPIPKPKPNPTPTPNPNPNPNQVYCLATNPNASLLASGSVDSDVRLWDPRDAQGHFTLRGHTDAVR